MSINNILNRVSDNLIDVFYPKKCPFCEQVIGRNELTCEECIDSLNYISSPRCLKCGKAIHNIQQEYCSDCNRKKHIFDRGVAAVMYSDDMRASMHRFKYNCQRNYGEAYAHIIYDSCGFIIKHWNIDAIIPVPMYEKKKRVRGYNQAEIIAVELGKIMNKPVISDALIRTVNTKPMKELDDIERTKNLQKAFILGKSMIKYRQVLLVDDIYTTGTTIDECSAVLKSSGVKKVYYVSMCIGDGF